LSMSSEKN